MKYIAILGTGPAGMMAAHACALAGRPFALFSEPGKDGTVQPSVISGAQFIHQPVPLLVDPERPDLTITYKVSGDEAGYRKKVYGENDHVPFVSFSNVKDGEEQPAWNLRRIYGAMWETIAGNGESINAEVITAETVWQWVGDEKFEFIVSTIPRSALCLKRSVLAAEAGHEGPHVFVSQEVAIVAGDHANIPLNVIAYNGAKEPSWYRASNIEGHQSVEWGSDSAVPSWLRSGFRMVKKPIIHDCDCWQPNDNVVFAGRYGKWEKGILVHDGFTSTAQALIERKML